jgi:hypothetical protein
MDTIESQAHIKKLNETMGKMEKNGENLTRSNSSSHYQTHMMMLLVTFGLESFIKLHAHTTTKFFKKKSI